MNIQNAVFLITGGASGLGEACVRRFSEAGAKIAILDVNVEAGNTLTQNLSNVIFIQTDVTSEESVQQAISKIKENFGTIHIAINCAGIAPGERVLGKQGVHSLASFKKVIEINLIGTFNVIRLAAEVMASNEPNEHGERGIIINTASVAAFDGQIGQAAYSASKGGIVGLTLPVARDLASKAIRVMAIAPGIFKTPMMAAMPGEVQESLGKQVPFPPRLGNPSEYAQLAQSIIENVMLNGEVIRLDGAIRMAAK